MRPGLGWGDGAEVLSNTLAEYSDPPAFLPPPRVPPSPDCAPRDGPTGQSPTGVVGHGATVVVGVSWRRGGVSGR